MINLYDMLCRLVKAIGWMLERRCYPALLRPTALAQRTRYLRTQTSSSPILRFLVIHLQFHKRACSTNGFCVTGFYSWRNTTNGSWFIQALCYVLSERGREEDLLSIMTAVSRIVAIGFESNTPQDSNMHQRKQIPCVTSLLTRKVYFKRKTTRRIQDFGVTHQLNKCGANEGSLSSRKSKEKSLGNRCN